MNIKELNNFLNNKIGFKISGNAAGVDTVSVPDDANFFREKFRLTGFKKTIQDAYVRSFYIKFKRAISHIRESFVLYAIYGSFCDGTYTKFSDIDSIIVLKKDIVSNPDELLKVRKKISDITKIYLTFDPLQHHGIFVIPEQYTENYPSWFLPLNVLENACLVYPDNIEVSAKSIHSKKRETEKLSNLIKSVKSLIGSRRHVSNLYELKRFLSQIFLIPSVYFQTKGTYIQKRDSFKPFIKEFPCFKYILANASYLRNIWPDSGTYLFKMLLTLSTNPWHASALFRKVNWHVPHDFIKILVSDEFVTNLRKGLDTIEYKNC